jgi:SHS2 domain-containing protein
MIKYELLQHTADVGIRVWGKNLNELFINAATAMFELITDISKVMPTEAITVEIEADDSDQLLRNWLSELLYYFNVKDTLLCDFKIHKINDKYISSEVKGEKINPRKHALRHEIKAVTFHRLHIQEKEDLLTTEIIFDV